MVKTFFRPIARFFEKLWQYLTEPIVPLPSAEDRRRAKISTVFLLMSFIFVGLEQIVGGNTPFITLVILLVSYFIARTRWYRVATLALLVALSFPSFLVALNLPNPNSNQIFATFSWIILPLILCGLLYSVHATIVFSAANIILLAALPFLRDGMAFSAMEATLGFYFLGAVFIILVMIQRDEFEKDRQTELLESRKKLSDEMLQRETFAEQAQRRADQLVMLNEVSRAISGPHGLEEILDTILEQVEHVIPLDIFLVALYDADTDTVTFPILFDNNAKWQEQPTSLKKLNSIATAIRSKQPLLINQTPEQIEASKKSVTRLGDQSGVAASALVSPLQIGTRIVGVISTQSYKMNAYNEEHLTLLIAIAQQVVVAIENARLIDQTKKRAQRLAILNDVGREISTLTNLPALMENVYQQVCKVLSTDLFFIGLYDKEKNELAFPIMYDNGRLWKQHPDTVSEGSFTWKTILTKEPLLINHWAASTQDADTPPIIVGDNKTISKSLMFAPMIFGAEPIGVLSVQSYKTNAYNKEDLNLLSGIANQVAIAIQNTRLLEETKQYAGRLSTLNELGRVVSELRDLPDLLEVIYTQVKQNLNVDAFFVGLYQSKDNKVIYPVMYDEEIRYHPEPDELTAHSYLYGLLHGEHARLILRTEEEIAHKSTDKGMLGNSSKISASLMIAPLKVGEQIIGVISVQSYTLNAYTEDDLNLLIGIGNQVGIAIQNARLLEETKQYAGHLSTLNELGRVISELRDLPDLLEVIYEQVIRNLRVDAFFVSLYHPENNMVSYPIIYDDGMRYTLAPDFLLEYSVLYKLIHGDHAAVILRTEDEMGPTPGENGTIGDTSKKSASLLYAPIKVGEQVIGVISAQSYILNAYTEDDLNLLVGIGNQVGVAIQNARLVEELKQNAKHLSILNEVGQAVSKIMDLPELLETIYQQGRKSISLDAFFVGLYHPETGEVSFPITYDDGQRYETSPGPVSENSFLRRFLNNEKSILINRTEEELAQGSTPLQAMGDKSKISASIIVVPLISRDAVIGMISAQSYTVNAYNESDVKILEGIASQVVIAIENSHLYTSAQQEIKERQRVELELQRERDFAVQIMNTLGQGVTVSSLDGVYEYVNPAYAQMLGYDPEDMIGKPSERFAVPDEEEEFLKQRKERQHGQTTTYETRLLHKDGHVIHVLVTGVPRQSNGRVIGSIAAITDLTERKQAEIERENMLKEMEAKNAELERFTYTVSHDLKSPIVTIGGFLGFLEKDIQEGRFDQVHHSIERIRDAAKRMQRLLSELLVLSRVGRIANPSQDVPFGELVSETLELVEGQLREGQVEVQVDADFPSVHVDRVRMLEVIQNLITNAIKFMGSQPNPRIHIGMETRDGTNVFFVKDNGVGIASEFHDRVFGLFNKLDPYTEGTGIGLTLVKRIIEVHNGKIWVESEPGRGATFFFTLENKHN